MPRELHLRNIERAQAEIARTKVDVSRGSMRQRYHFMGQQGWINDPNGLINFKGKYHFFYQYNPYAAFWGSMHWGHAVSDDMLHWDYLPVALAPSEPYDNHPQGGCFSGSAIEQDGKLHLVYTGTSNHGNGFEQVQCIAFSEDGVHFEKYANNPVLTAPEGYDPANFRDPKVWKHENMFYMVVGAKKDNLAQALLFASEDLLSWRFISILAESRGELGYMWECPDFYPLEDKYVLMFSPMGLHERKAIYLVGDMDYKTGKFHHTTMGEVDWGLDYYAPQSFVDAKGRRILVAWANAWDWMPWWKDWGPTYRENWCGAFSLPREAKLLPDRTLQFLPVEEIETLRFGEKNQSGMVIDEEGLPITPADPVSFEIILECDLEKSDASAFSLDLKCGSGHHTVVYFDLQHGELTLDRNRSDGWSKGVSRSPLFLRDDKILRVRILADTSSIEVFALDGRICHSCNVFADKDQTQNSIRSLGGKLVLNKLVTYGLSPSSR